MTTLFSSTRKVKVARRRPFAAGLTLAPKRQPFTAADLAWAAQNLNQTSPDYDTLAMEAEHQARYEAGFVPC